MWARTQTAAAMALRDQLRRPLVPVLLVAVPAFIVLWSVAITKASPHRIELPGGIWTTTTMKALHGPEMAKFTVAFVAALIGVFVMQSALQGDRRLVVAGYSAGETLLARTFVVIAAVGVVVAVAAIVTARSFDPESWPLVIASLILIGVIYSGIGAAAGALFHKVAATYVIVFLLMADLSVVQTPMFHPTPSRYGVFLPGYGPTRLMLEGAYSSEFHAEVELLIALGWAVLLGTFVTLVLRRRLG